MTWIDRGDLKGYRVPGSADRRVTKASLEAFLKKHGMESLLTYPAEEK